MTRKSHSFFYHCTKNAAYRYSSLLACLYMISCALFINKTHQTSFEQQQMYDQYNLGAPNIYGGEQMLQMQMQQQQHQFPMYQQQYHGQDHQMIPLKEPCVVRSVHTPEVPVNKCDIQGDFGKPFKINFVPYGAESDSSEEPKKNPKVVLDCSNNLPNAIRDLVREGLHEIKNPPQSTTPRVQKKCLDIYDICSQRPRTTISTSTSTCSPTCSTTTSTPSICYTDPRVIHVISTIDCSSLSKPTGAPFPGQVPNRRLVSYPRNLRELQNTINKATLPEDVRSLLKALAIYNQKDINRNIKAIKEIIEEDARDNHPFSQAEHEHPVGYDPSVKVGMMYYSNEYYVCHGMPDHDLVY